MKKFTSILTMVLLAALPMVFTSCELDDEDIAYGLDGVWYGEVASEYFSGRYGYETQYQEVQIEFYKDPYYYSSGRGREIDYGYYNSDIVEFEYQVRDRIIYIDYYDRYHTQVAIYNYNLYGNRFTGEFHDYNSGEFLAKFDFVRQNDWHSSYVRYSKKHVNIDWDELSTDSMEIK